tara:strand:- start:169 stop:489 length:321 start_codon:yes stop_codon:yes gene_type:complete
MSKFDSWVLDQQEKEQEQLAERLKKKENLKTFKVTERYIKQDTWIVNAINKEEATDIAMSVDPDTSEVLEVTSTTVDYIETFDNLDKSEDFDSEKYLNDPLGKEVS